MRLPVQALQIAESGLGTIEVLPEECHFEQADEGPGIFRRKPAGLVQHAVGTRQIRTITPRPETVLKHVGFKDEGVQKIGRSWSDRGETCEESINQNIFLPAGIEALIKLCILRVILGTHFQPGHSRLQRSIRIGLAEITADRLRQEIRPLDGSREAHVPEHRPIAPANPVDGDLANRRITAQLSRGDLVGPHRPGEVAGRACDRIHLLGSQRPDSFKRKQPIDQRAAQTGSEDVDAGASLCRSGLGTAT